MIPSAGVLGAAWSSVIGCAVMLSVAKFLCNDQDWLTDLLAILAVLTAYLISIGSWFALIGLLTVIPAMNSIRELRDLPQSVQEE